MENKKPEFRLEFNCFASMGDKIEASFIVSPEFELVAVEDMRHSEDTIRGLTLVFRRTEPHQLGRRIFSCRRIFSLKKEFEQLPGGEVTLDTSSTSWSRTVTEDKVK